MPGGRPRRRTTSGPVSPGRCARLIDRWRPSRSASTGGTGLVEAVVKKLFVLVLLAAAGAVAWRKVQSDRAEQALWAEVTDPVK